MKLSEIKTILETVETMNFRLPDGSYVSEHFHVTEVGVVTRNFIDCGGTVRKEVVANFQLWNANDFEHRLKPKKLRNIIALSERVLGMEDSVIEVEYQGVTINKYGLDFDGKDFVLTIKNTACLAEDACGITEMKKETEVKNEQSCCTPGGGCC
ncbi:DUF6428 family protein [Flavobacterium rakeshii]|uniref:DUF6428 family protein n=1 Tax=Flavobacterium rakeshii TaxID=1038845 RepID=UPI002E7B9E13|nr:DUF6428 family protein [Flavobacterium rakeshii]MEE1898829.1 DUF6428 family protein [Flavobacterium rakeshii]